MDVGWISHQLVPVDPCYTRVQMESVSLVSNRDPTLQGTGLYVSQLSRSNHVVFIFQGGLIISPSNNLMVKTLLLQVYSQHANQKSTTKEAPEGQIQFHC